MLPSETVTIDEFIEAGKGVSLSYKSFSFLETMSNGTQVGILDVINDYMAEIRSICVNVALTEEQYRKYCYKPKLLCGDIYGNPELYFIILLINDMIDVKEFDKKTFKMLHKDNMSILASAIYNAESKSINAYNTAYSGK